MCKLRISFNLIHNLHDDSSSHLDEIQASKEPNTVSFHHKTKEGR